MKRTTPLKRATRVKPRNPARRAKAFARAYGGEARVQWIRGLPCSVCGYSPCDNAHISSGGMGRKADADQVVPLCATHDGEEGCHAELHRIGRPRFEQSYGIDLGAVARNINAAWAARRGDG